MLATPLVVNELPEIQLNPLNNWVLLYENPRLKTKEPDTQLFTDCEFEELIPGVKLLFLETAYRIYRDYQSQLFKFEVNL